MHKILVKKELAPGVSYLEIEAPRIAKKILPGQFVVIRIHEQGERIPITVADKDERSGKLTILIQVAGKTTAHLVSLETGDNVLDVLGPLGEPTRIEKFGAVVGLGGGFGIATLHLIARELKKVGNHTINIIGARSKELLIMEDEMKAVSDSFIVTTDDGSYGEKGLVTAPLKKLIDSGGQINLVFAVGPVPMMKAVSELTRPRKIKTVVSLNPIMLDATGMCGVCRVCVGGETKLTCIHGPDFDGHLVDFDLLEKRRSTYLEQEKLSYERFKKSSSK